MCIASALQVLARWPPSTQLLFIRNSRTLKKALFIELPAFSRYQAEYLDDDAFLALQHAMMKHSAAGGVIEGTGGMRKLRHGDSRRGKGKRGGQRVIYYWWDGGSQFWLFTLFDKDEMNDFSTKAK